MVIIMQILVKFILKIMGIQKFELLVPRKEKKKPTVEGDVIFDTI